MRIPIRSESDAFRVTFGIAAVLAVATIVGVLLSPIAGGAVVLGAVLGVLVWEVATEDPQPPDTLREAAAAARTESTGDGRRRILVVANETVAGVELREEILSGDSDEIRVVCPILPSRAHLVTSDIDHELDEARERLERTLEWADEQGIEMDGRVSADTPFVAIADELRVYPADELIVSTHPPARSRWLESRLIEQLRAECEIPVRHVVVDLARSEVGV